MKELNENLDKAIELSTKIENEFANAMSNKDESLLQSKIFDVIDFFNKIDTLKILELNLKNQIKSLNIDKFTQNIPNDENKIFVSNFIKGIKKEDSTFEKIKSEFENFLDTITGENEKSRANFKQKMKELFLNNREGKANE